MSVLIIGAGPAGLAIAACLRKRGVAFDLVDRRGAVGGAYSHIYAGITLQSPARYTTLPGFPLHWPREYITAPEYRAYLERYAEHHQLTPRRAEVLHIMRRDRAFEVTFANAAMERFAAVVVATGMYDFPIWPDIPGLRERRNLVHVRHWRGPASCSGKRVLVIGGATAAVEVAEECAVASIPVVMSTRSGAKVSSPRFLGRDVHHYAHVFSDLLPRWIVGSYCDRRPTLPGADLGFTRLRRERKIDVRGPIKRFDGETALFADDRRENYDAVIVATGYRFEMPFLPPEIERTPAGHPRADESECRGWPGLYVLGIPCSRTLVSEFLRGIARDAPALANRIATAHANAC